MSVAREVWKRIESIHAVTYFADESIAAAKAAGLRGFWMGYFAFRAARLGAVAPGPVEASFANFAPAMVRRSLPDAWLYADPSEFIAVRANAAAATLRRVCSGIDVVAVDANERLVKVVDNGVSIGRSLFCRQSRCGSFRR